MRNFSLVTRCALHRALHRALLVALLLVSTSIGPALAEVTSSSALRDLTGRSTVTRLDCMRACAAVVAGPTAPVEEGAVAALLRSKGVVQSDEAADSGRQASRGYACLLFARALGEKGGVMFRLLPGSEHYAYRHLDFLDLIPSGGAGRPITGLELVSMVGLSRKRLARRARSPEVTR